MGETTGLEAKTIRRLLEFDPAAFCFTRSAELPLECDLLVGINGSWRVMPQPWLPLLLR